jgi:hypothetical protein
MAKDARGHGSEKRGAHGIAKTSTTFYPDNGQTANRVHWADGATTESVTPTMGTHMQALFDRARREGAPHDDNSAAAQELARGGAPGKGAVPTHPAMQGRSDVFVSRFADRGVNYLEPNDPRGAGARKRYAARISR